MSAERPLADGGPKILMACPNYWTSPFQVGSHHLARGFAAAGWQVAFISDPISPLHFLGPRSVELSERLALYRRGGLRDLDGRVWAYVPGALVTPHRRPLLRSDFVHRRWGALTVPNVRRLAAAQGFGAVDLLYFDSVQQSFWLNALPHRRSVLRIADKNEGFGKFTAATLRQERELAQRVDAVVYTAASLAEHVAALRPRRAFHLPNGVNFAHFAHGERTRPAEYASLRGPIAVYVGAMDVWFDYALVDRAVAALPDVSFVLIGPDHLARRRLRPAPNLHLLGRRDYRQLPAYLHHADVGLIPFDVAGHPELVNSVNPLKLYEYLACGLPVVATAWDELARLGSPAALARSADDFIAAVVAATSAPPDRMRLTGFAADADWSNRITALLDGLGV